MTKIIKNPAASVRARLLDLSKQRGEQFNFTLERYALERLLFRLSQTSHSKSFLLKGGMLLNFLSQNPYRATRDLDLLGYGEPSQERLSQIFQEACGLHYPEEGLRFSEHVQTFPIKEGLEYPGIRLKLEAWLEAARISLQIDVGFGDAVLKPCAKVDFEPFLGFPAPDILAYPLESVLAEKIHAMVELGAETSRMKDIYDLWYLAANQTWSSLRVSEAVHLTFMGRRRALPAELPEMFTPVFFESPHKLSQWQAFGKRLARAVLKEMDLRQILTQLELFWWPLLRALQQGQPFDCIWDPETWTWLPNPASVEVGAQVSK
ncbi:MAG: nucleotidyl transferase AbiEii/AbiGii toxin family protein [Candidatus Sericytochromatia bacterium]